MDFSANSSTSAFDPGAIRMDRQTVAPFVMVGLMWLAVGEMLCIRLTPTGQSVWSAVLWMAVLWVFCMFDLYALARAAATAIGLAIEEGEKRGALIIQAFYWGTIKLACLGILGAILLRGSSLPTTGLMMGSATLIVVPLLGGYWWSQKVLRHA